MSGFEVDAIAQFTQGFCIEGQEGIDRFERITRLVKRLMDFPVVSLDLLDPMQGPPVAPGDTPLLHWAGQQTTPTFVPDASRHPALAADPCVRHAQGLRAVGCWPLMDDQQQRIGSMLVADRVPRELDGGELELLGDLARGVELEVATHRMAHIDGLTGRRSRFALFGDRGTAAPAQCAGSGAHIEAYQAKPGRPRLRFDCPLPTIAAPSR
jgi:hypothetical protein